MPGMRCASRETQACEVGTRSFEAIAELLSERYGEEITSTQVETICERAQTKLVRALLADPELCSALEESESGVLNVD